MSKERVFTQTFPLTRNPSRGAGWGKIPRWTGPPSISRGKGVRDSKGPRPVTSHFYVDLFISSLISGDGNCYGLLLLLLSLFVSSSIRFGFGGSMRILRLKHSATE